MLNQKLTALVADILPAARIEALQVSPLSSLQLYLLNADYPQGDLPQEAMLKLMDEPFYWGFCWASGLVLAEYILERPALVAGKRVLDFGCGSGVVAIAAAMAGAAEVVACDIDPVALLATAENAKLNQVKLTLSDDFERVTGEVDLIIVADVLYDKANYPWLSRFVDRAAGVLIADPRVKDFDFPPYTQIDRRQAWTMPDLDESAEFRDVRIYQATLTG